ncbi:MAG TPA: hypothetical protein DCL54_02575 [Alphaproteobacteria bacterium]|nr:hypothetical protein [Alphaproteobacteria bacterium]HAJ45450.1 hypothetical protein [Alphaproteobacteria bacterium]
MTVLLGVAIIIVLGLMVGLGVRRAMNTDTGAKPVPATIPVPASAAAATAGQPSFNAYTIRDGQSVADARIEGGLLVVRVTGDAADEVMTLDPRTGELISRITFKKAEQP